MTTGRELAEAIAAQLGSIADCRVWSFGSDTFLPPGIVVTPPSMSWGSEDRTFCEIQWTFDLQIVVARPNDKTPYDELDRLVGAVADRLGEDPSIGGVARYARLVTAEPATVTVSGTDLPAYIATLVVIA